MLIEIGAAKQKCSVDLLGAALRVQLRRFRTAYSLEASRSEIDHGFTMK
jgi:hypothetical protein